MINLTRGDLSELHQVDHVDGGYVILPARQVVPPVSLLPEPEIFSIFIYLYGWIQFRANGWKMVVLFSK